MSKLTGAEIVIECLKEQGVDTVFGYPGGAILNIYDALYQHQNEITHILTSHEQGASHAADGYARATGKVGVCLATSGPGATNLVTGIEGDIISIDIDNHQLNVLVSDEEMAARKAKWQPREPKVTTGYLARYASLVTSGDKGAILQAK